LGRVVDVWSVALRIKADWIDGIHESFDLMLRTLDPFFRDLETQLEFFAWIFSKILAHGGRLGGFRILFGFSLVWLWASAAERNQTMDPKTVNDQIRCDNECL
jgi:hypothetical protein